MVIDINGKRVMTDPAVFSTGHGEEKNIDLIIITHEHPDHFHLESLKKVLENNPSSLIVTNTAVGKLLDQAKIKYQILEDKNSGTFADVYLEAHGNEHAFIRSGVTIVQNTGYFIGEDLFYPGDALTNPNKTVNVLALPVNAPWLKIEDVLQYARAINPKTAFSVHDGMLNEFGLAYIKKTVTEALLSYGVNFIVPELNKEEDL